MSDIQNGDHVFIESGSRIFRGVVTNVDWEIQVKTKCAKLHSMHWETLTYRADGSCLVGISRLIVARTIAQNLELEARAKMEDHR